MPAEALTQQQIWNFVGHKNTKEWMVRQKWRQTYQPTLAHELEQSVIQAVSPVPKQSTHHKVHRHRKTCPKYEGSSFLPHVNRPQKLYPRQLLPASDDYAVVPAMLGKAMSTLAGGGDPHYFTMSASEEHRLHPNFVTDVTAPGHALLQKCDRTHFRKKDEIKRHLDEVANMAKLGVMRS